MHQVSSLSTPQIRLVKRRLHLTKLCCGVQEFIKTQGTSSTTYIDAGPVNCIRVSIYLLDITLPFTDSIFSSRGETGSRKSLHLLDKTMYQYLGPRGTTSRPNEGHDDDGLRFDQLKIALKSQDNRFLKTACRSNMPTSYSHPTPRQPRIHYRPPSQRRCCRYPQH